jgi:hypothetical protein
VGGRRDRGRDALVLCAANLADRRALLGPPPENQQIGGWNIWTGLSAAGRNIMPNANVQFRTGQVAGPTRPASPQHGEF